MSLLELPISIGEALDKLSILDIKLDNIKDDRKNNVKIEYNLLYNKLYKYINNYPLLYKSLKKINIDIWNMMDKLRDGDIDDMAYLLVCKKTILYNDIRFRIKNKINILNKSFIKEEKGYNITKIVIDISNFNNYNILIEPILYLSFKYDKIEIVFNEEQNNIIQSLSYDNNIIFINKNYTINDIVIIDNSMNITDIYNVFDINYLLK